MNRSAETAWTGEGKCKEIAMRGCTSPEWASVIGSLFWALPYGM